MVRCNYNVVFYRVLCATLLATAVAFTVILTNVFIDIDWFLSNKNKGNSEYSVSESPEMVFIKNDSITIPNEYEIIEDAESEANNEYKDYYNEIDPFYRTKRSIESDKLPLHVKDPSIKKILTNRLASLLKELDEEEAKNEEGKPETTTTASVKALEDIVARDSVNSIKNEDLLHLAMHNILLQGMIGHMDLNDVYKKVHILVNNFNNASDKNEDKKLKIINSIITSKEVTDTRKLNPYNDEHKFFEELIKCKKLEDQIAKQKVFGAGNPAKDGPLEKDNKIYVKAVIEINEGNEKHNKINLTNSTENVEGLIKLIYNGKSIKVNSVTEKTNIEKNLVAEPKSTNNEKRNIEELDSNTKPNNSFKDNQNLLLNKIIEEYMKEHSPKNDFLEGDAEVKNIKTKRLKRQIKIRYLDDKTNNNPNILHENSKPKDDDIYIEIETHFDGKGIKGEKKKKLVRSLIEKIEKALHSDIHETNNIERIKFVKRSQDPIDSNKHLLLNKIPPPHDPVEKRQQDPIDKTLNTHEKVLNTIEDSWKGQVETPRFLSVSKSVNSAEMRELNIEYDAVLKNGIPKRLQKPINTEVQDAEFNTTTSQDLSNVTLLLKDIDGTGFSIGINKYVGEPPDKDTMKMFTGLENLIKEYHQSYDQEISNESDIDKGNNFAEINNKGNNRNDRSEHRIRRRSLNEVGNHYNNRIFFKNSNTTFENHLQNFKHKISFFQPQKDFIQNVKSNIHNKTIKQISEKFKKFNIPLIINTKLKAPEVLTLANTKHRNKRSLIVKKISNMKSKIKLSRFINTNAKASKKIFLKNKRNKRQINRIRIITRDSHNTPKNSDENIFMISRENAYSDKATLAKDLEPPATVIDPYSEDHYDEIYPIGDIYRIHHNTQPMYSNFYDTKRTSNTLMSKYPHIFINDDSGSKEDLRKDNLFVNKPKPYRIQPKQNHLKQENGIINTEALTEKSIRKVEEIINAIIPPASRSNYKLTLKITPKNISNISTGFKEVHTSVNKTYDENGVRYFSLFNVSQISKIEKLNKTEKREDKKDSIDVNVKPLNNPLKEQQMQIKTLLQLHKKRIDLQLGNLIRESKHLEKMIEANSKNNINKTIDILHDDIITTDEPSDDKINEILISIKKLQESYNSIKNNIKAEVQKPAEQPKIKADKPEIVAKSNEKITNEILKRIDTNTNILKAFLRRFSDLTPKKKEIPKIITTEEPDKVKLNLAKDGKINKTNAYYDPKEPKNATILPFIYAYQQNKPLASMVYQGHLHTNAIQIDRENNKSTSKIQPNTFDNLDISRRKSNGSKFFMDELYNDFKVAPDKPFIAAKIKINTTNV